MYSFTGTCKHSDLTATQKLLNDLDDWVSKTDPVTSGRKLEGHFLMKRTGPRQIWLQSIITGGTELGPVPANIAKACKVGCDIGGVVALTSKGWRLVEIWNLSP